ncbi:MAG: histidine phosphatase family protein [Acidimicrobiales bacterium]
MTRLLLVRHGEARGFTDQVVAGHEHCLGLSDLGRRQVGALAARFERTKEASDAAVLYSSILPRAIETAAILSPAIGGIDARQECDLCELHPGEADGMNWEEFQAKWGIGPWGPDPYARAAPGSETWAEFTARSAGALHSLAREHEGETVVVACHGGVIESSLNAFAQLPVQRRFRTDVVNASVTEWRREGRTWNLVRFNDFAHLSDL